MIFNRFREMTIQYVGKVLCWATAIACASLHLATFVTTVPGLLIIVPFFLMVGAMLCARISLGWRLSELWRRAQIPKGYSATAGWILLIYSVLLFTHFYRSSGGATSVGIVAGQYVYLSKETVIRPISETEYKMFPTHIARIMSTWLGMLATFCLSSLTNETKDEKARQAEVS
jgi:hypothetical protein